MSKLTVEILPCKLTQEDVLSKSRKLADLLEDNNQLERDLGAFKKQIKASMDKNSSEVAILTNQIQTNTEYRDVFVREEIAWDKGIVNMYRDDTGEKVRVRSITEQERQTRIEFDDEDDGDCDGNEDGNLNV